MFVRQQSSALKGGTSLPPPYSKKLAWSVNSILSLWHPLALCLSRDHLAPSLHPYCSVFLQMAQVPSGAVALERRTHASRIGGMNIGVIIHSLI